MTTTAGKSIPITTTTWLIKRMIRHGQHRTTSKGHSNSGSGTSAGYLPAYTQIPITAYITYIQSINSRTSPNFQTTLTYLLRPRHVDDSPPPILETTTQEEPIKAWRGFNLNVVGNRLELSSVNKGYGTFDGREAKAVCKVSGSGIHSPDNVPCEYCTCGFYAVKNKTTIQGSHLAEVDLYGKVIEHELGYRAEYQRILALYFKTVSHCQFGFLCKKKVEVLVFTDDFILPSCISCSLTYPNVATPAQISDYFGIEIRWEVV